MRRFTKEFVTFLIFGLCAATLNAQNSQVMPVGVFHFANPGLDVVKTDQINVMTEENQAYLERLTTRISSFRPTHVLLECELDEQNRINASYRRYLEDDFELESNENYQLGFRLARMANLNELACYDDRSVYWEAGPLFEYMPEHDPAAQATLDAVLSKISKDRETAHSELSLSQLLLDTNDPEQDRANKDIYILTNQVGAGVNFVGSTATASWWHRNFRMYANIQKLASSGTRVVVIGGQGHTAIIKDLIAVDSQRDFVDVTPYIFD